MIDGYKCCAAGCWSRRRHPGVFGLMESYRICFALCWRQFFQAGSGLLLPGFATQSSQIRTVENATGSLRGTKKAWRNRMTRVTNKGCFLQLRHSTQAEVLAKRIDGEPDGGPLAVSRHSRWIVKEGGGREARAVRAVQSDSRPAESSRISVSRRPR